MSIQNQQSGMTHLVVINGEQITEHGRTFDLNYRFNSVDLDLANGNKRRFIKKNKNVYSLSFRYLPTKQEKTIDGRKARDFLYNLAKTPSSATLSIKLDPSEPFYNTIVHVNSYTETLIRRDLPNQCAYYDVSITLTEA